MGSLKVDKLNFFWNATFQSGNLCQNNDKESIFIQKLDAFQMGFLSSLESTLIWGFNWLRNFALMISMENREKFLALGFSYAILVCNSLKVGRERLCQVSLKHGHFDTLPKELLWMLYDMMEFLVFFTDFFSSTGKWKHVGEIFFLDNYENYVVRHLKKILN